MKAKAVPPRDFTKRDWEALHFVYRLLEEVGRHGAPALDTFLAAMREVNTRKEKT